MSAAGSGRNVTLAVFGVAVLANLVLSVFLVDQVRRARAEVGQLTSQLSTKQDVAMLRPVRINEILEQRCRSCHTDRNFAQVNTMSRPEVRATIERMRTHPGANIPEDEVRKIEAALLVFRCTACHGEGVLSQIVLMPPDERIRFLRNKVTIFESGFRLDQVGELNEAFDVLLGNAAP